MVLLLTISTYDQGRLQGLGHLCEVLICVAHAGNASCQAAIIHAVSSLLGGQEGRGLSSSHTGAHL